MGFATLGLDCLMVAMVMGGVCFLGCVVDRARDLSLLCLGEMGGRGRRLECGLFV